MGRKKLNIFESKSHSEVLFHLAEKNLYAQSISIILGKEPTTILRLLQNLEKGGILVSKRIKLLNKKEYSINYETIIEHFVIFLDNYFDIHYKYISTNEINKLDKLKMNINTNKQKICIDKDIIKIFREIFIFEKGLKETKSLYEIYQELLSALSYSNKKINNKYISILNKTSKKLFFPQYIPILEHI